MGSMCTRTKRSRTGADYMAEEGQTDNQRRERAADQTEDKNSEGHKVFLHHPDDTGTGVDFGVNIKERDGRFVFKDVREDGLAHTTGLRSGDLLVMANSTDIDNVDTKHLLKQLLDYKERNYFIGVERKLDTGEKTFIWYIFKIVVKGGVPGVAVLEILTNTSNEIPETEFTPSTPVYDFLRVSGKPYNIYIEDDQNPPKYLTITQNKKLVFGDFNQLSKFFLYNYSDPDFKPEKGAVIAYSSYSSYTQGEKSSPATAHDEKTTAVLNFPNYMGGNNIPPDLRFWYLLASRITGGFSLQSMIAPGMYLGCGSDDKALLSTTKTTLQIVRD